jgi:release factor glutamine methyltransferase
MTDRDDGTVSWRALWAETAAAIGDRTRARWLCEVASGSDGDEFIAELEEQATQRMVAHLDAMIGRFQAGEPLQYVLGRWQFRTLDLMIDRRVLIPRPETEWVCERAIAIARSMPAPVRLVDLGTGSGAIGLSLAAELPIGSAEVWLTDASADSLDVARANLAGIGRPAASVRIAEGSWFEALPPELRGSFDLVVSNPPYVADHDPDVDPEVLKWEPANALLAGDDGLKDIRVIVDDAVAWLRVGGALVLEIGAGQGPAVTELLDDAEFRHVAIEKDLAGRDRIAIGFSPS